MQSTMCSKVKCLHTHKATIKCKGVLVFPKAHAGVHGGTHPPHPHTPRRHDVHFKIPAHMLEFSGAVGHFVVT